MENNIQRKRDSKLLFNSRSGKIMNLLRPFISSTKVENDGSLSSIDEMKIIAIQPLEVDGLQEHFPEDDVITTETRCTEEVENDGSLSSINEMKIIAIQQLEVDGLKEHFPEDVITTETRCSEEVENDGSLSSINEMKIIAIQQLEVDGLKEHFPEDVITTETRCSEEVENDGSLSSINEMKIIAIQPLEVDGLQEHFPEDDVITTETRCTEEVENDGSLSNINEMKIIAIQPLEVDGLQEHFPEDDVITTETRCTEEVENDGSLSSINEMKIIAIQQLEVDGLKEHFPEDVITTETRCSEVNEEDVLNFSDNIMCSTQINFEDNGNSSDEGNDNDLNDKDYLPSSCDNSENEVTQNESLGVITADRHATSIPFTNEVDQHIEVTVEESECETSQTSNTTPIPTRKRKRDESTWKSVIKRNKVNSGQSYRTKSDKIVPAKVVKGICGVKCRAKCPSKISVNEQKEINKAYWELSDRDRQHDFIMIYTEKLQQKSKLVSTKRNRSSNIAYYLTSNKIRVCKDFFLKTINISEKVIRNCYKRVDQATGVLQKSQQGMHTKHCIEESEKEMVRNHIKRFPKVESHYLRNRTRREFLDGSLSIREMYRLFIESHQETKISESMYRQIFNTEFNLSFFVPKKDLCSFCEKFKNADDKEKTNLKEKFESHEKNKILSRKEKEFDVNSTDSDTIVSCFDLQAVLSVPCGEVSVFYYKRKLNCYNFTIFNIKDKQGHCQFWPETIAKRGVNEIATFVYLYLKDYCQTKKVIFYSDNCAGQNKNRAMVALYCYAVAHLNIEEITHKFLIVGHTQNEGDSMHSVIEKEKKRVLRSGPIYVPAQWSGIIKSAKKTGKPFVVNEPDTGDIKDFKDLSKQLGSNWGTNEKNEKVRWNDIKVINVKKDEPNKFLYKTEYDQENFKKVNLRRRQRGRQPTSFCLKNAYIEAPRITLEKYRDLLDLCTNLAIPTVHHNFFKSCAPVTTSHVLQEDPIDEFCNDEEF